MGALIGTVLGFAVLAFCGWALYKMIRVATEEWKEGPEQTNSDWNYPDWNFEELECEVCHEKKRGIEVGLDGVCKDCTDAEIMGNRIKLGLDPPDEQEEPWPINPLGDIPDEDAERMIEEWRAEDS